VAKPTYALDDILILHRPHCWNSYRHPLTWLLAFALIAWSLASYFPRTVPAATPLAYWLMGGCAALLLLAAVLLPELSHSVLARRRELNVDSITLFIFAGVSNLSSEPTRPSDEILVAVVGPLTSLVVGGAC
jgi:Zn-dependent protease